MFKKSSVQLLHKCYNVIKSLTDKQKGKGACLYEEFIPANSWGQISSGDMLLKYLAMQLQYGTIPGRTQDNDCCRPEVAKR